MASENVGELIENHKKARNLIKENAVDGRLFRQAAEEGNLNMVKFFLKAKYHTEHLPLEREKCTNEGAVDENGVTPLHLAASNGHSAVVQCLLSSGAQVDVENKNKESPLYLASREGHKSVVNILLRHGADPYFRTLELETAVQVAAAQCHHTVVECLVNAASWHGVPLNFYKLVAENDIDPNIVSKCGGTVLHQIKDVQLVNYLLQYNVLVDARDSLGNTSLHMASYEGHIDIVKILIDHGAYVNTMNKKNETPLYLSVSGKSSKEHFEVAKTLLENDADVNKRYGEDEDTVLICALGNNMEGIMQLLLDWGADVNAGNRDGNTVLHGVAWGGNVELAQLLIERGAKVNAVNKGRYTPLHFASDKEMRDLLLQKGADVTIRNRDGFTPLKDD